MFATNHKDIGIDVPAFLLTMLMVGGLLAMLIRASCSSRACSWSTRAVQLVHHRTADLGVWCHHAGLRGLRQLDDPLQIGASDMAFARMNNLSFGC